MNKIKCGCGEPIIFEQDEYENICKVGEKGGLKFWNAKCNKCKMFFDGSGELFGNNCILFKSLFFSFLSL